MKRARQIKAPKTVVKLPYPGLDFIVDRGNGLTHYWEPIPDRGKAGHSEAVQRAHSYVSAVREQPWKATLLPQMVEHMPSVSGYTPETVFLAELARLAAGV